MSLPHSAQQRNKGEDHTAKEEPGVGHDPALNSFNPHEGANASRQEDHSKEHAVDLADKASSDFSRRLRDGNALEVVLRFDIILPPVARSAGMLQQRLLILSNGPILWGRLRRNRHFFALRRTGKKVRNVAREGPCHRGFDHCKLHRSKLRLSIASKRDTKPGLKPASNHETRCSHGQGLDSPFVQ
jgi:hypothetical protein